MRKRRWLTLSGFTALFVLAFPVVAWAQEEGPSAEQIAIDTVWVLVAAFLVFFMQAGFAMVEAGFTRQKNAANIVMKNLMDFGMSSIAFWAIGFAIMFGAGNALIGTSGWFLSGNEDTFASLSWSTVPLSAKWIFQVVFAGTAATIVSGAMAERTKFRSYLLYSGLISGLIYPVSGHWIWGGGWLATQGFLDFAGSTVVHSVGGWAALVGAIMLGPRIGRYRNGKPQPRPGHSMPLAFLGVFILWFGWFGFNPGSTMAANALAAHIAVTTNLAAAAGAITAMYMSWIAGKKPDVGMTANGALAGLVAITAPCAFVEPWAAVVIGAVGGIIVVPAVKLFDKMKIDDPVGAISVHAVNGVWGTLAVGLFAAPRLVEGLSGVTGGFFYGEGLAQLGTQALGVAAVAGWTIAASLIIFGAIKYTIGLRVSAEEEIHGLDIGEHGMWGYPESFLGPDAHVTEERIDKARIDLRESHASVHAAEKV